MAKKSIPARNYPLNNTQNRMFLDTAIENRLNNDLYLMRLLELSASMFDWQNMPDSCDVRTLELSLLTSGRAVFFKDDAMNTFLTLCVNTDSSRFDVYGNPRQRTARSLYNNYHYKLTNKNSVMIYNNYLRTPSLMHLMQFADRLGKIDEIIDININAQKTPILILCDEKSRLTMKNLYMKYDGNQPFIFADRSLNPNEFQVLKTDAPFVADKLYQQKNLLWNEALTYLGISNVSYQKKERLVSDEVSRNMGGTIASRYARLNERQKACELINKMFGLDIWCVYKEDYNADLLEQPDEAVLKKDGADDE